MVVLHHSFLEGTVAPMVCDVRVSPFSRASSAKLRLPLHFGRIAQGRALVATSPVDVGAAFDKEFYAFWVFEVGGGIDQDGSVPLVCMVDVGAVLQKARKTPGVPSERLCAAHRSGGWPG